VGSLHEEGSRLGKEKGQQQPQVQGRHRRVGHGIASAVVRTFSDAWALK